LLHGTTAPSAALIRWRGFRSVSPKKIAEAVASVNGVGARDVFNNVNFEFARNRKDRNRVHFTSSPRIALAHTVPEVVQDALRAVWDLKYGKAYGADVTREQLRDRSAWVEREGRGFGEPEVLAVTMPWKAVGNHAFGRTLSLQEWQSFGRIEDLHSISVPIRALQRISIAPYGA
jgi:hypothetical protein